MVYDWNRRLLVLDSRIMRLLDSKALASLVWVGAGASNSETAGLDRQDTLTLEGFYFDLARATAHQ